MRILVVGGGGREHALCWALSRTATVFCAPGNPGTRQCATNLPESANDHAGIAAAIRREHVDLTVVGPEAPLAEGLVDHLAAAGLRAFGPTKAAARITAAQVTKRLVARSEYIMTLWPLPPAPTGAAPIRSLSRVLRIGLPRAYP